ncbi:hypothetical protein [Methylobacterium sp. GC_Met_2]|uniref:hypothetical protein n=1 Tax=Methylobacterium sp. GC_Met_2 TaxID=2937376 RepID=UPI00226B7379|nr:hypothetical protein [Methylobacterium sp. GC_Met_2]
MSIPPCLAFGGDAARKSALLARLDEHRDAGTVTPSGPSWTGVGGTPAGCIAGSNDPADFARATGFPSSLMPLLDFLCPRCGDEERGSNAGEAADLARAMLMGVTPGADLTNVPGLILCALLDEASAHAGDEPEIIAARDRIEALHRAALAGHRPGATAWRAARAAAVTATDAAREPAGQRFGRLVEAVAWDPAASSSILQEVAMAWLEIEAHAASAATGWTAADDAAVERCFQACRSESLAAGGQPEAFAFPPLFHAREPELARRFAMQLAAANAAYFQAVRDLARRCLDYLAAARPPGAAAA